MCEVCIKNRDERMLKSGCRISMVVLNMGSIVPSEESVKLRLQHHPNHECFKKG